MAVTDCAGGFGAIRAGSFLPVVKLWQARFAVAEL